MKLTGSTFVAVALIVVVAALSATDALGGRGSLRHGKKSRMPWNRTAGDSYAGESRKSSADKRRSVKTEHTLKESTVPAVPRGDLGAEFAEPPPDGQKLYVTGKTYVYRAGIYYQRVLVSGEVVYRVVEPPFGAIVDTLPSDYETVEKDGSTQYKVDDTFYRRILRGGDVAYIVTKAH